MASKSRSLRAGYTTGACAAAAAKAATLLLLDDRPDGGISDVEIPFPDGSRHVFTIAGAWRDGTDGAAFASVVKDAGDDPDVTHGAEVVARVVFCGGSPGGGVGVVIRGGEGVGVVTRPGLPVPVGAPAINPVPRKMITEAVTEALSSGKGAVEVTISVPGGGSLAKKTLNGRLGIAGGISILGTTGIVKPLSAEAWTATISASMSVARAMGRTEVVLSTGRSSERAHMGLHAMPEECYAMMGDYVEYALLAARDSGFERVHLCGQWAKMLKIAMSTPQTHVRHGAIDPKTASAFLECMGVTLPERRFNTVREMFDALSSGPKGVSDPVFPLVCGRARGYAESVAGMPVRVNLVSYWGEVIATDG